MNLRNRQSGGSSEQERAGRAYVLRVTALEPSRGLSVVGGPLRDGRLIREALLKSEKWKTFTMRKSKTLIALLCAGVLVGSTVNWMGSVTAGRADAATAGPARAGGSAGSGDDTAWTSAFPDEHEFSSSGTNPYFILKPEYVEVLEGHQAGKIGSVRITVTNETEVVDGVETRVVEERETEDGVLAEVSRNFIAISKRTNSVFYFGEDVSDYKNGRVVGHRGSWRAGVRGAKFGLLIPGTVLVGGRFQQELAPGVAMDRSEIVGTNETVRTPAGKFEHCLILKDSSPSEPEGKEPKAYAPGIGIVRDEFMYLTKYGYLK